MSIPSTISSLYPFKGNFIKVTGGHSLHYIDEGAKDGIPTVFLHGNPTWSFFYRELILRLQEQQEL